MPGTGTVLYDGGGSAPVIIREILLTQTSEGPVGRRGTSRAVHSGARAGTARTQRGITKIGIIYSEYRPEVIALLAMEG